VCRQVCHVTPSRPDASISFARRAARSRRHAVAIPVVPGSGLRLLPSVAGAVTEAAGCGSRCRSRHARPSAPS